MTKKKAKWSSVALAVKIIMENSGKKAYIIRVDKMKINDGQDKLYCTCELPNTNRDADLEWSIHDTTDRCVKFRIAYHAS